MPKKLIKLLLFIVFLVFITPSSAFAAPSCTEAGVTISQNPGFISQPAPEVKFTFSNLSDDFYYMRITPQAAILQGGYSTSDIASTGGVASFLIKEDPRQNRLFPDSGVYSGMLRKNTSPTSSPADLRSFTDYCTFTFTVGTSYTLNDCRATAPFTVQTGQDIIVNFSNAPQTPSSFLDPSTAIIKQFGSWKWPIIFDNKYAGYVTINPDGNGTFVIPNNPYTNIPKTEVGIYLVAPPEQEKLINWIPIVNTFLGDTTGRRFCLAIVRIVSSSTTISPQCSIVPENPTIYTTEINITATNLPKNKTFWPVLTRDDTGLANGNGLSTGNNGFVVLRVGPNNGDKLTEGSYKVKVKDEEDKVVCEQAFTVGNPKLNPGCTGAKGCTTGGGIPCDGPRGPGIQTAIGCIHTNPAEFVTDFMTFAIAISGGLAFLMMLLGAFQMITSSGNPDTLHAGRERLTSAIIGLLFVIFATLLMQIIGVDILFKGISGFKQK